MEPLSSDYSNLIIHFGNNNLLEIVYRAPLYAIKYANDPLGQSRVSMRKSFKSKIDLASGLNFSMNSITAHTQNRGILYFARLYLRFYPINAKITIQSRKGALFPLIFYCATSAVTFRL